MRICATVSGTDEHYISKCDSLDKFFGLNIVHAMHTRDAISSVRILAC
jgi:hypothetical protein